jgi:hypothetical protein
MRMRMFSVPAKNNGIGSQDVSADLIWPNGVVLYKIDHSITDLASK